MPLQNTDFVCEGEMRCCWYARLQKTRKGAHSMRYVMPKECGLWMPSCKNANPTPRCAGRCIMLTEIFRLGLKY